MSSSQRVIQNQDGLEMLQKLVELAKDPKSITAAAELARKEAELTQEQVDKLVEAKDFIAKYEQLSKDFEDKTSLATNDLINQRTQLESDSAEFVQFKESESQRLKDLESNLNARESKVSDAEKSYNKIVNDFESYRSSTEKKYTAIQNDINKQKSFNDKVTADNQDESKRLSDYKNTLQQKAQNLSKLSAEFNDE